MSLANDIYQAVEPTVVSVAAVVIVGLLYKGYSKVCAYLHIATSSAVMSKQAAADQLVQSALDNVASGIHSDIMQGKVQLSTSSIKAEGLARFNQVVSKVPEALATLNVPSSQISVSLAQKTLGKVAAAGLMIPTTPAASATGAANGDNPLEPKPVPKIIPVSIVGSTTN
jgi:hypothetical protein